MPASDDAVALYL